MTHFVDPGEGPWCFAEALRDEFAVVGIRTAFVEHGYVKRCAEAQCKAFFEGHFAHGEAVAVALVERDAAFEFTVFKHKADFVFVAVDQCVDQGEVGLASAADDQINDGVFFGDGQHGDGQCAGVIVERTRSDVGQLFVAGEEFPRVEVAVEAFACAVVEAHDGFVPNVFVRRVQANAHKALGVGIGAAEEDSVDVDFGRFIDGDRCATAFGFYPERLRGCNLTVEFANAHAVDVGGVLTGHAAKSVHGIGHVGLGPTGLAIPVNGRWVGVADEVPAVVADIGA